MKYPLHETKRSDIWPAPGWLSYTPVGPHEYVIDTSWGYESDASHASLKAEFCITDLLDPVHPVKIVICPARHAARVRANLIEEVRILNGKTPYRRSNPNHNGNHP